MKRQHPIGEGIYGLRRMDNGQLLFRKHNLWMYSCGIVLARCVGYGNSGDNADYTLRMVYLEFENVASPGDTVSVPTVTREDDIAYYNELASSGVRDFLRIPLQSRPGFAVSEGYEDFIPEGEGNSLIFSVNTTGQTIGRHGKAFNNSSNSKLFGIALVAAPVPDDPTRDIVYARDYYETAQQIIKPASTDLSAEYAINFL